MTRFDVRTQGPEVVFSSLSGGNQQKAVLAREITLPNLSFLLAAQPTRGLDVGAVAAVYGHIRTACARGAAVLAGLAFILPLLAAVRAGMLWGSIAGILKIKAGTNEV